VTITGTKGTTISRVLLGAYILFSFVSCGDVTWQGNKSYWHDKYVYDQCQACPECCTTANDLARLEDGDVCFEENADRMERGWTEGEIKAWCIKGGAISNLPTSAR